MFKVVVTDYTYENLDIERKILARPDIELKDISTGTQRT